MFTAYALLSDRTTETLETVADLAHVWDDENVLLWIDLEAPSEEEIRQVDSVMKLDEEALDDCLHGEQRPRIDEYDNYIFLVVYGLLESNPEAENSLGKLAVFCGDRFLVTVHREPVPMIDHSHERCRKNPSAVLQRGVDHLLYSLIDRMVDQYLDLADAYEGRLEVLEDRSQGLSVDDGVLYELPPLRRELLELRRLATSLLQLLEPISEGEYDYVSEKLGRQFAHVRDHLLKVVEQIDGQRELINGLRDNYHAVLSNQTNDIMRVLTLFATVLMPLSLISGIFGMNFPLWPPQDSPASFWTVIVVMGSIATGLLWYFRRRRWL